MSDAAVALPGVGTAAGDGGGVAIETPPVETGVETPEVGTETQESGAEQVETGAETQVETSPDGRIIPQKFREMFKQNPELRNLFFSERAYRQAFPTVQEANQARELLETIGGTEGWESMQAAEQEQTQRDEAYYSRNPQQQREFVKYLLDQDAGAFNSIVPVALEEFRAANPQAYNRTMSQIIAGTFGMAFNRVGLTGALAQLKASISGNDGRAAQIVDTIEQWANQFDEIARSQPQVDPEREKFEREREEWQSQKQQEENQAFRSAYTNEAGGAAQAAATKHLSGLLAGRKLDQDSMNAVVGDIFRRVSAMASKDATYMKQINAIAARKDKAAAVRLFSSKFNQLLPEAAKVSFKVFNLGAAGAKPQPKPGAQRALQVGATEQGVLHIAKRPTPKEIDYSKSPNAMLMRGEAVLKTGKRVKWE